MSQNPAIGEGTVVITSNQTAGRGQHGNSWEAAPGMNLTFSVILRPRFLAPKDQFNLNVILSLALAELLGKTFAGGITIKWPNDILVHGKKICGILVENLVQGQLLACSVCGIGLNVNQRVFQHPGATSIIAETGVTTNLEEILHRLLGLVESRYLQLRSGHSAMLRETYLGLLHWRQEKHTFASNNATFEGTIEGVDEIGRLAVHSTGGTRYFGVKEIAFIQ